MKRIIWLLLIWISLAVSLSSQSREQYYQLGKKSFQDQLYTESIGHLKNFMDYYPNDPRIDSALYMVGVSWYYLRNYPSALAALKHLEDSYETSPYLARTAYWQGLVHYSSGQYTEALVQFERQLENLQEEYYYETGISVCRMKAVMKPFWDRLISVPVYPICSWKIFSKP